MQRNEKDFSELAIYAPNCSQKDLAKMLHAESEKRIRAVKADSKLKNYIKMRDVNYMDSLR